MAALNRFDGAMQMIGGVCAAVVVVVGALY